MTQDAPRVDQLAADSKRDERPPDSYGRDVEEWIWIKCDVVLRGRGAGGDATHRGGWATNVIAPHQRLVPD